MQIYIADLQAYNSGYLKGEWIKLPTEEDDIQDAILRQSQNVQSDFAIHDWELPFEISEYTNPLKINELCHTIQELNLNKYLIQHLEYAYGVDLKNTDTYTLKNYLDNIYYYENEQKEYLFNRKDMLEGLRSEYINTKKVGNM